MNQSIKTFLEFNDQPMYFILKDSQWWVALKPICEALKVDYIRQFKNVKEDPILAPVLSKQTIQIPDDQAREMICLPEFYIYGWLFQIRSSSELLLKYKWECYRILYEHFKGTVSRRKEVLTERVSLDQQIATVEEELNKDDTFLKWKDLTKRKRSLNNKLKKLDTEIIQGVQGEFSFPELQDEKNN